MKRTYQPSKVRRALKVFASAVYWKCIDTLTLNGLALPPFFERHGSFTEPTA